MKAILVALLIAGAARLSAAVAADPLVSIRAASDPAPYVRLSVNVGF